MRTARRLILIVALIVVTACESATQQPQGPRVSVFRTDSVSTLMLNTFSGYHTAERLVVTDQARWIEVWTLAVGQVAQVFAVPPVDFGEEGVLLASYGATTSAGYLVSIDSMVVFESGQRVYVTSTSPGPGCMNAAVLTFPVHIVKVPRPVDRVSFEERRTTMDCS